MCETHLGACEQREGKVGSFITVFLVQELLGITCFINGNKESKWRVRKVIPLESDRGHIQIQV